MNVETPHTDRRLAILRFQELLERAFNDQDIGDARWYAKCLDELENMTNEEFDKRYKDIDE